MRTSYLLQMFLLLESCICGKPFKFSIFYIQAITNYFENKPYSVCPLFQSTLPLPQLSCKFCLDNGKTSDFPNLSQSQCCPSSLLFLLIFVSLHHLFQIFNPQIIPVLTCSAENLKCFHNFINQTHLQYCKIYLH